MNPDYEKEINRVVDHILNSKDYRSLELILKNYDYLVKRGNPELESFELPYWCINCWFGGEVNEEV